MGALVIAAVFAILVSFTSDFVTLKDQPPPEIQLTVTAPGPGFMRAHVQPLSEIKKDHLVKQTYDYSCGSAALAILMNYYLGEKFTEKQVIQGLLHYGDLAQIQKRQAFSLLDMKRFVNVLGYKGEGYRVEIEDLMELDTPAILPIKIFDYRHFVVFRGIHNGHIFLADPWRGDISFTLDDFQKAWYEKVIFVVSRQDNLPTLTKLKLRSEDLVYIDEDRARQAIFGNLVDYQVAASEREFKQMVDVPGEFEYFRLKK
ncbi:MAG TPA: C39 family peptidase [Smithella sp.]|nr:C39 family peptidase [Smithella sp.]HRS97606.1 C39 family peptidase [Smithella sp.]